MISALLTGLGGALYPGLSAFATPDVMLLTGSGEFIIMVMIGGLGRLPLPVLARALLGPSREVASTDVDCCVLATGNRGSWPGADHPTRRRPDLPDHQHLPGDLGLRERARCRPVARPRVGTAALPLAPARRRGRGGGPLARVRARGQARRDGGEPLAR